MVCVLGLELVNQGNLDHENADFDYRHPSQKKNRQLQLQLWMGSPSPACSIGCAVTGFEPATGRELFVLALLQNLFELEARDDLLLHPYQMSDQI